MLEGQLADTRAVGLGDPQIAVASTVGQIDQLRAVRANRRCLRNSGLLRDSFGRARVVGRRGGHRKTPDVGLDTYTARHNPSRLVDVGFGIGHVTERELAVVSAVAAD